MKSLFTICSYIVGIKSAYGQSIQCNNAYECFDSILSGDYLEAQGYKSAAGDGTSITTTSSASVVSGSFGVYNADSFTAGGNVDLTGAFSGMNNDFSVSSTILISGYGTGSMVNSKVDVSTSSGSSWLRCAGDSSCKGVIATGDIGLWANAAFSASNVEITTGGNGASFTFGYPAYYAGYNSTVTCSSGDRCSFSCYASGCFGAYINCETGATCYINNVRNSNTNFYAITDLTTPLPDIPSNEQDFFIDIIEQGLINDENCNLATAIAYDVCALYLFFCFFVFLFFFGFFFCLCILCFAFCF